MKDDATRPTHAPAIGFRGICLALICLSLLLWGAMAPAAEKAAAVDSRPQTLDDLLERALAANPRIEKARQNWRSAIETYRTAVGLPAPQLMVTYFPEPIETRLGPQDWNAAFSVKIPYPAKLIQRGRVAHANAEAAQIRLNQAIRDVVVAVREAYYELGYIRSARQIAATNSDLLDHLRKVSETSHAEGQGALIDVIRAQAQSGQIRYDILLLADLEAAETARLNSLLDRPVDTPVGVLVPEAVRPLSHDLETIYTLAEVQQDEIRIKTTEVARAAAQVKLARSRNRPDLMLGLFYAGIGEPDVPAPPPDAGEDAYGVQVGVSVPLWFGQNRSRVAGARAEERAAKAALRERVNQTRAEVRRLYFRLQTAERTVVLYRDELLPQALSAMRLAETWFREGQGAFTDAVEAQALWYNFNLALARARADYGKFLARLEKIAGQRLTAAPLSGSEGDS